MPKKPDSAPAAQGSFIQEECESDTKFSVTGTHSQNIPYQVWYDFKFIEKELKSGWFATQTVDDDINTGKKLNKVSIIVIVTVRSIIVVINIRIVGFKRITKLLNY